MPVQSGCTAWTTAVAVQRPTGEEERTRVRAVALLQVTRTVTLSETMIHTRTGARRD